MYLRDKEDLTSLVVAGHCVREVKRVYRNAPQSVINYFGKPKLSRQSPMRKILNTFHRHRPRIFISKRLQKDVFRQLAIGRAYLRIVGSQLRLDPIETNL